MKISNAFIVVSSEPIQVVPTDRLADSHIYRAGGYTPHLFRRSRLKRFAPVASRVHLAKAVWRWAAAAHGPPAEYLVTAERFGVGRR